MKLKWIIKLASLILLITSISSLFAQEGRWEKELSGEGWKLWLDQTALWYNDDIYLPPVDLSMLPVNPPSCGWSIYEQENKLEVNVPGTVEEHYWGDIGGAVPDTGGNYVGVSWWSTSFELDPSLKGKRITIYFESVNLRAEVFVNGKLCGYDVIGNTPFEVYITDAVSFTSKNKLDIRITDPVGNFSWNDKILMRWGKNLIPAVHGFGGITGPVILRATDHIVVEDVYVQNQPNPKKIKVFVELNNYSNIKKNGSLILEIHPYEDPSSNLWRGEQELEIDPGKITAQFIANVPDAELWQLSGYRNLKEAVLYKAQVSFSGEGIKDNKSQRFGFRWFDVGEKDGDQRFYLNGKRVFIMAVMTRGFWPKNGIFATEEMAQRDMETMVDLGMNMMLLHRAMGQPPVIEYSDKMGLITYEEPGGYGVTPNEDDDIDGPDEQALELRREKLRRMIIRDRSFPSMIIFSLKNGTNFLPTEDDVKNIQLVHELDPSRIITYNSGRNRTIPYYERLEKDPIKLHMRPFDDHVYYEKWWDHHHGYAYPGYVDINYSNPRFYLRGVVDGRSVPSPQDSLYRLDKGEIIFFGEEGAFGTMVRLQKIAEELEGTGATGFREQEHIDWFNHYNRFLDETGYRSAFKSVDELTLSMGRNLHYFQGRTIENVRMSNIADGYDINGWASASTRTDLVDMYRYSTADRSIIRHYTQPLYLAVKLPNKVVSTGTSVVADIFIINEIDVKGEHSLVVELEDPNKNITFNWETTVEIAGGEEFGQLLYEGIKLPQIKSEGYYKVNAKLLKNGESVADGFDDIYSVNIMNKAVPKSNIFVLESDSIVKKFLKTSRNLVADPFAGGSGRSDIIVVGNYEVNDINNDLLENIFDQVLQGAKLIVLENADVFAKHVNSIIRARPPYYKGGEIIKRRNRGRHFVGYSPYLDGLPQAQAMGWEYQYFYSTKTDSRNGLMSGLNLETTYSDWIVSLGAQNTKDILCSLNRVELGKGEIFLSTLNILPGLSSNQPNSAVAKKIFLNLIENDSTGKVK
ncbi:MAG: glycoside hydrolase family 2 TIM barrel-domain containing protein [Melioribacteraceae bacterium]|nr:glycoside hydrolase family 2 TIM barrel-domain containing protein [Melioribacteraceae bacterium]